MGFPLIFLLFFCQETPVEPLEKTVVTANGTFKVGILFETLPIPLNQTFGFELRLSGQPIEGQDNPFSISVDARMPQHRHGMVRQPTLTPVSERVYRVDGMLFHMPGRWEIYVDVTVGYTTERGVLVMVLE